MWRPTVLAAASVIVLSTFVGCGGCEDPTGSDGDPSDGDALTSEDGSDLDTTVRDSRGPTDSSEPGDGKDDGGSDTPTDGSGASDGGDVADGNAGSVCRGTKTECSGTCVDTRLNPDHCGSCGNSCPSNKVCNAGKCADSCPTGLDKCGNRCVDKGTNDEHCGECNETCARGTSCNHGDCTNAITVNTPTKCSDGGPNIEFESPNTQRKCSGRVAKTTFRWALCSCDDVRIDDELRTDAYDSSQGPYVQGGYGGGIGTNGEFRTNNKIWMYGSLWTSSNQGIYMGDETDIKLQVHSEGPLQAENTTDIRGNAFVGGDIIANDRLEFHQTLTYPSSSTIRGSGTVTTNRTKRNSVSVSQVCSRCRLENRIPVRQIARNHETNNDNGAVGLRKDVLQRPGDKNVLKLPCGEYYLSEIDVNDETVIVTSGHTALYIGSDVYTNNKFVVKPTPGSTLDMFVAGDVTIDDEAEIGSPAYPANMRLYVGGADGFELRNEGQVGAYIYAMPGGVDVDDEYEQFGGMYAQNFDASNKVWLHYDRGVLDVDRECGGGGGSGRGGDAGTGSDTGPSSDADGQSGTGDTSDAGSGGGSTCSQKGGSCNSDSDCCAPLACNGSICESTSCSNIYESCSVGSDCCSGICGCSGNTCQCVSQ